MSDVMERTRTRAPREVRKPVYLAFAKVGGGWVKIGAAWRVKSGEDAFSLQIATIPLNWDGRFILAIPTASGEPQVSDV